VTLVQKEEIRRLRTGNNRHWGQWNDDSVFMGLRYLNKNNDRKLTTNPAQLQGGRTLIGVSPQCRARLASNWPASQKTFDGESSLARKGQGTRIADAGRRAIVRVTSPGIAVLYLYDHN